MEEMITRVIYECQLKETKSGKWQTLSRRSVRLKDNESNLLSEEELKNLKNEAVSLAKRIMESDRRTVRRSGYWKLSPEEIDRRLSDYDFNDVVIRRRTEIELIDIGEWEVKV